MRELVWMGEGKVGDEWGRTSHILAMLAEANRDRKKRSTPYTPADFNPTIPKRKGLRLNRDQSRDALKMAFLSGALGWRGAKKP